MSTVDPRHERLEELIALDALGGLDEVEGAELATALAEHGPECAGCAELLASSAGSAALLAFSLDPVAPSPGAEERLIAAARAQAALSPAGDAQPGLERPALTVLPGGAPATDQRDGTAEPRTERRGGTVRRWIAIVAVAATLGVGLAAGFVAAPRPPSGTTEFMAFAAEPGTKFLAFPSTDGSRLSVAYRPGETRAWVFGAGLTKPSGGRTYELWWGAKGTALNRMNAAGLFVPIHGNVATPVTVGTSDPGTVLGVTIEPPGGSPEPTTDPVYVNAIS